MVTLNEINDRLLALKLGDSGVRVTDDELMALNIPEIPIFDTKSRAEWLRKQLPFSCDLTASATTGDWVYSRPSN